jgi:peptidyl-prolyl cis-trans isomerase SurA
VQLPRVAAFLLVLVPYVSGAEAKPSGNKPRKKPGPATKAPANAPATPPVVATNAPTVSDGKSRKVIADRIAAVVDDSVILISELDLRMLPLRHDAAKITNVDERNRRLAKLALQTLDEMVNDELVLHAAIAAKLTVDQQELQATLDFIKKENKLDDAQLADAMKQQGISTQTIKNDLLRQRAINQIIGAKVQVTEDDIRARYDQMSKRSEAVKSVNVSQILISVPEHPTEPQLADAKRRAQDAIQRVKGGEAFATVAGELTDDATTKSTGGMLGWLEPSTLDPAWEAVVFGMDKDEVRGPISGAKGLYVLYANEVKRTELQPYAKMKEQIASELRRGQLVKLTRTWIEELRKKAYIDIKLK